jgi:hypothetical protein
MKSIGTKEPLGKEPKSQQTFGFSEIDHPLSICPFQMRYSFLFCIVRSRYGHSLPDGRLRTSLRFSARFEVELSPNATHFDSDTPSLKETEPLHLLGWSFGYV